MTRRFGLLGCLTLILSTPASAGGEPPVDLPSRARGAEQVVVATVARVQPQYQVNEFGDRLIVSHVQLDVREVLKGVLQSAQALVVEVEGGTVGDITLRVSDLPQMRPGEQAVFFLRRDARGSVIPHLRGLGILKLDRSGQVRGEDLTLDDVRQAVRSHAAGVNR